MSPGASTEDGANTERMSVLNVCSRRCLDFNWGVMCVFLIENFILSLAPWGAEGSELMGPQNPDLHVPSGPRTLCTRRSPWSRGWASPPTLCLQSLPPRWACHLGMVGLLAPVQRPTLRGAACRAQPLCCVQTPQCPVLGPDTPAFSAQPCSSSLLTHASFSQGSCLCPLALETSASSCDPA